MLRAGCVIEGESCELLLLLVEELVGELVELGELVVRVRGRHAHKSRRHSVREVSPRSAS
jgi:hypothetical protein